MASHSGTHLDAPLHKIAGGKSIDQFPLESFRGRAVVVDLTDEAHEDLAIGPGLLERSLNGASDLDNAIVLLNTGWGLRREATECWLWHAPFLQADGAAWLVQHKVRGVGIDHFSIGGMQEDQNLRTHEVLLGAGVWIVEELCFREGWRAAQEGAVFQALPLSLPGFSGSPCRAVLIQD